MRRVRVPLHRSLLFWAGMMVAVFSGWAWWHSTRHLTALRCGNMVVMNAASRVSCGWIENHGSWLQAKQYSLAGYEPSERIRFGAPRWALKEPAVVTTGPPRRCGGNIVITLDDSLFIGAAPGDWQLFVPHWMIFAGSALPCMCVVLYRAEKQPKRKQARTVDSEG